MSYANTEILLSLFSLKLSFHVKKKQNNIRTITLEQSVVKPVMGWRELGKGESAKSHFFIPIFRGSVVNYCLQFLF